jgi:hypothetical protein
MSRYLLMAALFLSCIAALLWLGINGHNDSLKRGNEAATVSALQIIARAQQAYSADHGGAYGTFQQLIQADFLDERFDSVKPKVNDYVLTMTVTPKGAGSEKNSYSINADPDGPGARNRHFYFDVSGLIHVNDSRAANADDPLLKDPELDWLTKETPKARI